MNKPAQIDPEARLRQLHLVGEMAAALSESIFSAIEHAAAPPSLMQEYPHEGRKLASQVRAYLKARRVRERMFPPDLFADPAWDMLLDLYASRLEGRKLSIGALCLGGAVPSTTGLRWIGRLEELGLALRQPDPSDMRRTHLFISDVGADLVRKWWVGSHLSFVEN